MPNKWWTVRTILDQGAILTVSSAMRELGEVLDKRQGEPLGDWMHDVQHNGTRPASFANG